MSAHSLYRGNERCVTGKGSVSSTTDIVALVIMLAKSFRAEGRQHRVFDAGEHLLRQYLAED